MPCFFRQIRRLRYAMMADTPLRLLSLILAIIAAAITLTAAIDAAMPPLCHYQLIATDYCCHCFSLLPYH